MSPRKRIGALLGSHTPNWNLVSEKDITSSVRSKIERFTGLHRYKGRAGTGGESKALADDIKKLYAVLASKLAANVDRLDKKIHELEVKEREPATAKPFDSIYLQALKSARSRLPVRAPVSPSRPLRIVEHSKPAGEAPPSRPFAKVLELHNAFSTEFDDDHRHFVKSPMKPGVQACLIELKRRDGTVRLIDALTVLPKGVSQHETVDPIYAAYLNLIDHEYESDIEKARACPKVRTLAARKFSEPPFMCAAQTQIRQRMFETIEKYRSRAFPVRTREALKQCVETATEQCLWHPRHLVVDRTRRKWAKVWAILARWDEWELQQEWRWADRVVQHCADLKISVIETSTRAGRTRQVGIVERKNALRKMCHWLERLVQLKRGDLSKRQRTQQGQLPERNIVP